MSALCGPCVLATCWPLALIWALHGDYMVNVTSGGGGGMASTEARPGHSTASTSQHQPALAPVCASTCAPTLHHHNTAILVPSHCRFHQLYLVLLVRTKLTPARAVSAGKMQHCSKGKGRSARRQCRQCSTWGLHTVHTPHRALLQPP